MYLRRVGPGCRLQVWDSGWGVGDGGGRGVSGVAHGDPFLRWTAVHCERPNENARQRVFRVASISTARRLRLAAAAVFSRALPSRPHVFPSSVIWRPDGDVLYSRRGGQEGPMGDERATRRRRASCAFRTASRHSCRYPVCRLVSNVAPLQSDRAAVRVALRCSSGAAGAALDARPSEPQRSD